MRKTTTFAAVAALATLGACAHQPKERSYGNDMLPAAEQSYGNDALPSAEVTAFQKADARLKYAGAQIARDSNGCALYQGRAPDGQMKSEALFDAQGNPLCPR